MARNPQSTEIYNWLEDATQSYFLAVVFGSYARGEAYSSSDVDVLLIDEQFDGWTVLDEASSAEKLNWPPKFPPLHLVCTSKEEFETRYQNSQDTNEEPMIESILEEGFAVNDDFGLVDYVKSLKEF